MKYVPLAIIIATAFDALYMLFRRFDVDYLEGCEVPRRWIAWGTCWPRSRQSEHVFRYFVLRLPSYQWTYDCCNDRQSWGQLTLLRFAGKWRTGYWIG